VREKKRERVIFTSPLRPTSPPIILRGGTKGGVTLSRFIVVEL